MPLRRGNVEADTNTNEAPPPFDMDDPGVGEPTTVNTPQKATPPGGVPSPQQATTAQQATPPPKVGEAATTSVADQDTAADEATTQVAPNKAPVAVADPPTQLPATQKAGAGALTGAGVGGGIAAELVDDGFEGLEFGFGAFPMVTLQNNGTFEFSGGGVIGIDFYCKILGSKSKYIFKNGQKKALEDFVYSYDQVHTASGDLVQTKLDEWKEKGWGEDIDQKRYLDVQAQIVSQDTHNGELVLLSIPPNSINRFSGYIATVKGRHCRNIKNVITHVHLGDRVAKGDYPFTPWAFSFYGDAED